MTDALELDTLIIRAGGVRRFAADLGCTPHAVAIWVSNGHMPAYRALQAAPIYGLSLDDAIALANGTRIPGRRPKPRNIVEKGSAP